jgi:hypothetical protein
MIEVKDTSPALTVRLPIVKAASRIKNRLLMPPNNGNGSANARRAINGRHGVPETDIISAGYNRYGTRPLTLFDGNEIANTKNIRVTAHFVPVFSRCTGESPRLRRSMLFKPAAAPLSWDIMLP